MKSNIYFLGIGGIGMSALVKYFHSFGKNIAGYDRIPSDITKELENLNINCIYSDEIENIPEKFLDQENTLIIITPAIPKTNKQYQYFLEKKFEIKKRAEVLGLITKNSFNIAVSGTHGKTTTSSILAHIFHEIDKSATSFLGGILEGYNSNYMEGDTKTTIVEADEFDRSFLYLSPNIACITSDDPDHLDIYKDVTSFKNTFLEFANKLEKKENLIIKKELNIKIDNSKTYSIEDKKADFYSHNIRYFNGKYVFDFISKDCSIKDIELNLLGRHNVENATVAIAIALTFGHKSENIKNAISTFKGIKRRCSILLNQKDITYIDDYAHHPTEIKSIINCMRESFPQKKLTVVFQPHLFSRTRDFIDNFAKELEKADNLILLEIYPARELPIEGINSKYLFDRINIKNKILLQKENLLKYLKNNTPELLLTIGAGDIGEMTNDVKNIFV